MCTAPLALSHYSPHASLVSLGFSLPRRLWVWCAVASTRALQIPKASQRVGFGNPFGWVGDGARRRALCARLDGPFGTIPGATYISYRVCYAATRSPGARRDPLGRHMFVSTISESKAGRRAHELQSSSFRPTVIKHPFTRVRSWLVAQNSPASETSV